ncbi:MAG: ABC transporter ATP-binding protein/permease [Clostridia bacterium]|nr:ABC transporter ATP-binding protein/permease [Clostridia bacterium]
MLELKKLDKTYKLKKKKVHAVKSVDLTFKRGEFVSILGLSGSGKTTLVSLIGGLEEPSGGQLLIDGIDTCTFKQKDWTDYRKNTIGFVFQDFNLITHLTAIDNVKIALSLSGYSEVKKNTEAMALLEKVGMAEYAQHFPAELSGGQQQRIAIARALANSPEIILADEPTGALDPDTSVQIMTLLQDLAKQDHLVIMVTHNKYLAQDYSSRIVKIDKGVIISDENIKEAYNKEFPPVVMKKSSLQFTSALKVAFNNLKIRRKSSIFALMSLIPSMILVILLGNFIVNLLGYEKDISPIYNRIINDETVQYLSPMSDHDFEWDVKNMITNIQKKRINEESVKALEQKLFTPYDDETLKNIESLDFVEAVFPPNYYDVTIEDEHFILVGLLPEAYQAYQYDFNFDYYPKDDEEGLIFSSDAANVLLGKYNDNPMALEGQSITFNMTSYNSIPFHYETQASNKNQFTTEVIKVFDPESKTTLMSNYYKGYIYASSGYINTLKNQFDLEDISLILYELVDVLDPRAAGSKYLPIGGKNLTDLLLPLRTKNLLQEDMALFSIRKFAAEVPSSNFMMRYQIITKGPLTETQKEILTAYGTLYPSQFDEFAIYSAKETGKFIDKILLYAKITIGVIIALPSILVALILYISIILRTKEIGVLKSIGAKAKDIITIFTCESGMLAITSGIVALMLSFPALNYAKEILEKQYHLTYYLGSNPLDTNVPAILGSMISIVLIITFLGLLPGRKASKLHPRVLLRNIN